MPHEEQRKLQQIGKSFCIILPKPWVRYYKLNKGDLLTVISNENIEIKLVKKVMPEDKKPEKTESK